MKKAAKTRFNSIIEELRKDFINTITLSKSANTTGAYSRDLINFVDWIKDAKKITRIDKVTDSHITEFLNYHKILGAADSSVKRVCSSLKSFYKFLVKRGMIEKDIMAIVDSPRVEQQAPFIPTADEVRNMISRADGTTTRSLIERALMELLYSSGLRASELCQLEYENYSAERREVVVVVGKRNKTRTVPITQLACDWINRYVEEFRGKEEGYLFVNIHKKAMQREHLGKIVRKYGRKAGLRDFTAHTFRHACASHLLQKGADLRLIQKVLGHASIASTQRYTHLTSVEINSKFQELNSEV